MKKMVLLLLAFSFFPLPEAHSNTYSNKLCSQPNFTCLTIQSGDTWRNLWPKARQREIIMKVNRVNVKLKPGMRIAVPHHLSSITLLDLTPFPHQINSSGRKLIKVDLSSLAWGAYDPSGQLVRWGPVAGGMDWCEDVKRGCKTVTGHFTLYSKGTSACKSSKYPVEKPGAPMPYCMFFHKGYGLHGSNKVPGYHASHGCVRMFTDDAKWLNQEFVDVGNTKVVVGN